ncbi:MAG: SRPBCC domain-containing protein [Bacteroidota bacterium]
MEFTLQTILPAAPQIVYEAWMSSQGHAAMTGAVAEVQPMMGGNFTAWNGYIQGQNLYMAPYERIVQTWRTTEFAATDPDSQIEVILEGMEGKTRLTLIHTQLPSDGDKYKKGWQEHYFAPMHVYFDQLSKF